LLIISYLHLFKKKEKKEIIETTALDAVVIEDKQVKNV